MFLVKNSKRALTMVLALGLVLSATGCGKKEDSVLTGSTVKLADGGVYPIQCDDELTVWGQLDTNLSTQVSNFGETELAKKLKEKTGVNVTYVHPAQGQLTEQFNLLIASGKLPDIIQYSWYGFGAQSAIDSGYIMKLNDVLEKWAPNLSKQLSEDEHYDRMVKTDEGSYYVFPFFRGDKKDCVYSGPIIRKDWLDKLGMDVPETIDEWDTMLRRFKNELNVDIPLSARLNHLYTLFGGAYGVGQTYLLDDNGKVKYGPAEDKFKDFLTLLNGWYKEGLLDVNIANVDSKTLETYMLNDRVGATLGSAAGELGKWVRTKKGTGFDLVGAHYPVMNKGEKSRISTREWEYNPSSSYAISAQCKNPELAVRFLDYGYSDEGRMLYNFGTEGLTYNMVDGNPVFTDLLTKSEAGLSVELKKYAMGSYSGPFVQDSRVVEQMQAEPPQVRPAVLAWDDTDAEKHIMPLITENKDEAKEMSKLASEINTYSSEMMIKFVVGAEPLDNFEAYQRQLKDFGLDRALEIKEQALKRYYDRN